MAKCGFKIDRVCCEPRLSSRNIVLIGMPGCGKSSVARKLGEITSRPVADSDDEITKRCGAPPEQIIEEQGEDAFREIEATVLKDLGKQSGLIIATGGGAVVKEDNYNSLHQNGIIVWLQRDLEKLADANRPILQKQGAQKLYQQREVLYRRFADTIVKIGEDESLSALKVLDAAPKIC